MIVGARPFVQKHDTRRDADEAMSVRLHNTLRGELSPDYTEEENGKRLVNIFWEHLEDAGYRMDYVGPYLPDPMNPSVTNPRSYERFLKERGCPNIPLNIGVIGLAIRARQSYLVRSIPELEEEQGKGAHWACNKDQNPENRPKTELVLMLNSRVETGPFRGIYAPRAVLDLDFLEEDAVSELLAHRLKEIWKEFGKILFPGPPQYDVSQYAPHIPLAPIDENSCQI